MENVHILEVEFLGPTNSKGSRVIIKSSRFGTKKIIPYDHYYDNTVDVAAKYLQANGFNLIAQAELTKGYAIISNTFKSL